MKALYLVGGSGTRLRPLTDHLPKPMIPVMGRPLLERTCMRMKGEGVNEMVFSACYKPRDIIDHFKSGRRFGLKMNYLVEEAPLGTGGAIKNAQRYFDDSFFVLNADVLCDIAYGEMLAFHREKMADVTIAATFVQDPSPYGAIEYDEEDMATRFTEKPAPGEASSHYINAGIYVFEPHVLDWIDDGRPVSVEREVFPALLERGARVAVYRDAGYWMDIGTPEKYLQAHQDIFQGRCRLEDTQPGAGGLMLDPSAWVDDSVLFNTPVFVGKNASIDAGCLIGENVAIGDGVRLGRRCIVADSIIWPKTRVEDGSVFIHTVAAEIDGKLRQFPYRSMDVQVERRVPS